MAVDLEALEKHYLVRSEGYALDIMALIAEVRALRAELASCNQQVIGSLEALRSATDRVTELRKALSECRDVIEARGVHIPGWGRYVDLADQALRHPGKVDADVAADKRFQRSLDEEREDWRFARDGE